MNTMENVYLEVSEVASRFGFRTERCSWNAVEIMDDTDSVSFTVRPKNEWHLENRSVTTWLSISACIATMGGNPTPDELFLRSTVIKNAAKLCEELGNGELYELCYETNLDKED